MRDVVIAGACRTAIGTFGGLGAPARVDGPVPQPKLAIPRIDLRSA